MREKSGNSKQKFERKKSARASYSSPATADITDLVEFSINETKPEIKTRRGVSNKIKIYVGQNIFLVTVTKFEKEEKVQFEEKRIKRNLLE